MAAMEIYGLDKTSDSDVPSALHRAIFDGWACAMGDARILYLSGPVTTGRRLVDALRRGDAPHSVIADNLAALHAAAVALRATTHTIVIDPSPLLVDHWSQDDYMALWTGLIDRHAGEVRFMPGWEYSLGCTKEFAHATRVAVPTFQFEGAPIDLHAGREHLDASIADLTQIDHPALAILLDGLIGVRAALTDSAHLS